MSNVELTPMYIYRPEVINIKTKSNRYMIIVGGADEKIYVERSK